MKYLEYVLNWNHKLIKYICISFPFLLSLNKLIKPRKTFLLRFQWLYFGSQICGGKIAEEKEKSKKWRPMQNQWRAQAYLRDWKRRERWRRNGSPFTPPNSPLTDTTSLPTSSSASPPPLFRCQFAFSEKLFATNFIALTVRGDSIVKSLLFQVNWMFFVNSRSFRRIDYW